MKHEKPEDIERKAMSRTTHMTKLILAITASAVLAQSPDAIQRAAEKHPELRISGSPLHAEFMRIKAASEKSGDPIMRHPDWPTLLADEAAVSLSQKTKQKQRTTPALDGFLDIPWRTPSQDAVRLMMARHGVNKEEVEKTTVEVFKGGEFAGLPVSLWVLGFGSTNQFHTAKVHIDVRPSALLDSYNSTRDLISEKYGKPELDVKRYSYPYDTDVNGHELTAIKLGKATIYAAWTFPVEGGKPNNIVSIEITESQAIVITYQNGELIKAVVSEKKDANKKDL